VKAARVAVRTLEQRADRDLLPPSAEAAGAGPGAHVRWLIENYDAPRQLLSTSAGGRDTVLEAVAEVYRSRPRRETFIEWLWRNYPPQAPEV
jgi:hypothetical protein